ncbi:LysR family transcriptional regulator [Agathobaculum massiliense]|uniref:LysR family transcriptional regulator n=1 Tax=Agathobaculum massiliense TaxID=3014267 RepID=UPI0036F205A7
MDIRVLEYFLAVAREQTISGAAMSLHMTQPPPVQAAHGIGARVGQAAFPTR